MNAFARRAAFQATRAPVRITRRQASGVNSGAAVSNEEREASRTAVKQGAKRDPELYVRLSYH